MKAENFCFWLQGFFEIGNGQGDGITAAQAEQIKTHLALVFKHDPTMAHPAPAKPDEVFRRIGTGWPLVQRDPSPIDQVTVYC